MTSILQSIIYFCLLCCLLLSNVKAEPYHLIAGSSALGFRENDEQNVNLGFHAVFNALLSSKNVVCDFKSFDDSSELAEAIKSGQVNSFFGSPVEFLQSEHAFLSSPIASGVFNNILKSRVLLVIKNNNDLKDLSQLAGKKLATQKWISGDIGGLYLETLLLEKNLPEANQFFLEIQNKETSNKALVDLFFNKVDVVLVSENQYDIATELNPQMRQQTKILIASEPYLIFVSALAKSTPPQEVNAIKNSLLAVHKTAKGRNILNLMKLDGFREVSITELDNIRALITKNERLKAKVKSRK